MNNGNAHQSKWSQDFHAARGNTSLPCPVVASGFNAHPGTCRENHPRGIVVNPAGTGWTARPALNLDDIHYGLTESYV